MIQIKLSLVNLIQKREPTTHRWMVKRRFNYNNNVATLGSGNFIVIYPLSSLLKDIKYCQESGMVFTRRPASLLWRFIIWRALSRVPAISFDSLSRISMKFWANLDYQHINILLKLPLPPTHLYPYSMLSPQPPQIQADLRSLGLLAPEQPQLASWPSRQPRDTECTTPALATAWAKAASFEAETETEVIMRWRGRRH